MCLFIILQSAFYLSSMNDLRLLSCLLPLCFSTCSFAESIKTWVMVNDIYKGRITLSFSPDFQPCLTRDLLGEWGVHDEKIKAMALTSARCVTRPALAQNKITSSYDRKAQLLFVEVPAELITRRESGVVTSRWDEGINAAFIHYRINYGHYAGREYQDSQQKDTVYADVTLGGNIGAWRLRYRPVYHRDTWGKPEWDTEQAVAYRAIRPLRASLSLGDNYTSSSLFDSINFRGISLASDERMLPDRMRAFSPIIRGYARSNAEVKVRQNGEVIYQTFVAPGVFVLKDVYPPWSYGDIQVTVKESDGTESVRRIPYSAIPTLVHYKNRLYGLTVGQFRPYFNASVPKPLFGLLTLSQGISEKITLYSGVQISDIYQSGAIGIGKDLGEQGQISMDYHYSSAKTPVRSSLDRGSMLRLSYARLLQEWESSLSMTVKLYSRQRYRTFSDAVDQQHTWWWDWEDGRYVGESSPEKQSTVELRYNKNFSESDSIYLTLGGETFYGKGKNASSVEIGYSGTWKNVDVTIYAEHSRSAWGSKEQQLALSVSIPFKVFPGMKVNSGISLGRGGNHEAMVGISGTALEDYSLSYSLSSTQERSKNRQDGSIVYQHNAGDIRAGYSHSNRYRKLNLEATGSVVGHAEGVTLGQYPDETTAIVSVPGRAGIGIDNQYGVTTDKRGYALVGSLIPYRVNRLSLSTYMLPPEAMLSAEEVEVVPTAGAIMFGRFMPEDVQKPQE